MNPCVIGIDIGGTNTVLGLVERSGNCVAEATLPTRGAEPVGQFLPRLCEHVEILLQRASDEGLRLQGIGIGAPNANYYTGTIEHPPNLAWEGVTPLAGLVRERFGCRWLLPTTQMLLHWAKCSLVRHRVEEFCGGNAWNRLGKRYRG